MSSNGSAPSSPPSNLRNRDKYRDAAWDWSILNGCFNGHIRPTDIDGFVERNGHFLFIEAKPLGARINQGQSIGFMRLASEPRTTFVYVFGPVGEPHEMAVLGAFQPHGRSPCDIAGFRAFIRAWSDMAEQPA